MFSDLTTRVRLSREEELSIAVSLSETFFILIFCKRFLRLCRKQNPGHSEWEFDKYWVDSRVLAVYCVCCDRRPSRLASFNHHPHFVKPLVCFYRRPTLYRRGNPSDAGNATFRRRTMKVRRLAIRHIWSCMFLTTRTPIETHHWKFGLILS